MYRVFSNLRPRTHPGYRGLWRYEVEVEVWRMLACKRGDDYPWASVATMKEREGFSKGELGFSKFYESDEELLADYPCLPFDLMEQ